MNSYYFAIERHDFSRINKLNKLSNKATFWDDVRTLTKKVSSDHAIGRWQGLAEIRYYEILSGQQNVTGVYENGKPIRFYDFIAGKEVFPISG